MAKNDFWRAISGFDALCNSIQNSPSFIFHPQKTRSFSSNLLLISHTFSKKLVEFSLMVSLRAGYCSIISETGTLSYFDLQQLILNSSFRPKTTQKSRLSSWRQAYDFALWIERINNSMLQSNYQIWRHSSIITGQQIGRQKPAQ